MMIPRILVVEDEQEIAKILKIELEYEGYEVLWPMMGSWDYN